VSLPSRTTPPTPLSSSRVNQTDRAFAFRWWSENPPLFFPEGEGVPLQPWIGPIKNRLASSRPRRCCPFFFFLFVIYFSFNIVSSFLSFLRAKSYPFHPPLFPFFPADEIGVPSFPRVPLSLLEIGSSRSARSPPGPLWMDLIALFSGVLASNFRFSRPFLTPNALSSFFFFPPGPRSSSSLGKESSDLFPSCFSSISN